MTTEIKKINPADFGLEEIKANELIKNLPQIISERDMFISQFDEVIRMDIDNPETAKQAREIRLRIRDNRTKGIEVWHRTTKDFFLRGGQFVDAIKRLEIAVNQRMEDDLEKIEKYREDIEKQRIAELQLSRSSEISKWQEDGSFIPPNLGELTEELWQNYLLGVKTAFETKKDAEKAAKEAEEKRIAEEKLHNERREEILPYWQFVPIEYKNDNFAKLTEDEWKERFEWTVNTKKKYDDEQEAIRFENEKLKKDREKMEISAEAERKKQADILAKQKADADAKLKAAQEQAAKEAAEAEAERKKLADQLKSKQDADAKLKADADAREQAEFSKGDAEKVNDLISDLLTLKSKYIFKSAKSKKMYADVSILIDRIIQHIKK